MSDYTGMFQPSDHTATPAYRVPAQGAEPTAHTTPATPFDVDAVVFRQIQIMQAAGWTMERTWPGGADFISRGQSSISIGMHLLLCVLTLGLWFPVMVIMEASVPGAKRCRMIVDENGLPQFTQ